MTATAPQANRDQAIRIFRSGNGVARESVRPFFEIPVP
jgi:hypothetical protein